MYNYLRDKVSFYLSDSSSSTLHIFIHMLLNNSFVFAQLLSSSRS